MRDSLAAVNAPPPVRNEESTNGDTAGGGADSDANGAAGRGAETECVPTPFVKGLHVDEFPAVGAPSQEPLAEIVGEPGAGESPSLNMPAYNLGGSAGKGHPRCRRRCVGVGFQRR